MSKDATNDVGEANVAATDDVDAQGADGGLAPLDPRRPLEAEGAHPVRHFFVVVGPWLALVVVALAVAVRYSPPDAAPMLDAATEFSATRALVHLDVLDTDDAPYPVGAPSSAAWIDRIEDRMRAVDLEPERQTGFTCGRYRTCADVTNLVARIPGTGDDPRAVLLMAHHDTVVAASGAADDKHAVASLIEIGSLLVRAPLERDVILLISDAEEAGLLGAERFLHHRWAPDVGFVVNLEARGTHGPSVLFQTLGRADLLMTDFGQRAARPIATSLAQPVYEAMPNDTDLTVFRDHLGPDGTPVVAANLAFVGGGARYHTPLDDREWLDADTVQHQGDNALALVRTMAGASPEALSETRAKRVYFDVLGVAVVAWPRALTLPLALAALGGVAFALLGALLRRRTSLGEVLAGSGLWMVAFAAGIGSIYGLGEFLVAFGALPPIVPFPAHPAPIVLAGLGVGLLASTLPVALLWQRLGVWAWWGGAWLGVGALGVASAAWVPEASYLFAVPCLLAATVGTLVAWSPLVDRPWARVLLATAPLLTAGLVLLPPSWLLIDAVGLGPLNPAMVLVALVLTTAWPLLRQQTRRWTPCLVALGFVGLGASGAVALPTYSEGSPMRANLIHHVHVVENPDSSLDASGRWHLMTLGESVPGEVADLAPWSDVAVPLLPWSVGLRDGLEATDAPTDVPAPYAELIDPGVAGGDRRVVELRVRSARGARFTSVGWADSRIEAVTVEGWRYGRTGAWSHIDVFTTPESGVAVEVTVRGDDPVPLWIVDKTFGPSPDAGELLDALPAHTVPTQDGHAVMVSRTTLLPPAE